VEWVKFKALDFIWGNGESTLKLVRAVIIFLVIVACIDFRFWEQHDGVAGFLIALLSAPAIFIGVLSPEGYPKLWLTAVAFVRLTSLAFFMSIIIKRFNRR
jgi:hypothetical protein